MRQGVPSRHDGRGLVWERVVTASTDVRRLRPRPDTARSDRRRRLRPHVRAHRQGNFQAAVRVARVHPAELVPDAGGVPAHRRGLDPADRADHLHAQHPARRVRRRRHLRRGRRARRGDPARSAGDRARGGRRRLDGHLRRPRRPHHPRGDRRAGGARHRPDPAAGGPPRGGVDVRRASAQRRRHHHRPCRRLHLRRVHPERLRRRLCLHADPGHRPARGADLDHQGA